MIRLRAWTLPLIVTALAVPVVAGFWLGGPPLGMAVGFIAAAALIVIAARAEPVEPIVAARAGDELQHVLIVLSHELDDPAAVEYVADQIDAEAGSEVRLLAPAKSRLLDRWATDLDAARTEAQRKLVISTASLSAAELDTRGATGDENIVRAVEDELRTFPASEVIVVTGGDEDDPEGARAAQELSDRLRQPMTRVVVGGAPAGHGPGRNTSFAGPRRGQSNGDAA
jgi:hypothetical protein